MTSATPADKPEGTKRRVWGAANIGAVINKSPTQTFYLLERGLIRGAKKVGRQWTATVDELEQLGADSTA
jgi:hypothetical protein